MGSSEQGVAAADALVFSGATGDLAHKMIFPALYRMVKSGTLKVPVIGVASSGWGPPQLRGACLRYFRGDRYGLDECRRARPAAVAHQVVALLAMEPPAYQGMAAVHTKKFNVFKAMRPLNRDDVVRGQFSGYRHKADVATHSDVETLLRPSALHRLVALGRRPVVPAVREVLGRNRRRGTRRAEAAAPGAVRRFRTRKRSGQLPAYSAFAQPGDRSRGPGQTCRRGVHGRPA